MLSFLKHFELAYISSVNKEWYDLCKRQEIWFTSFLAVSTANRPPARVCHTSAILDDKIYIIGGHTPSPDNAYIRNVLEDIWCYDINGRKWTSINSNTDLPLTESNGVVYKRKWYMFGGFGGDSVWRRVCRVYSFDFDTNEFKIFHEPKGLETSPPPRSVHSVCLYNDLIYIYGGWDSRKCFNDLWSLDVEQKKWTKVEYVQSDETTKVTPPATRYHAVAVYGDYMYICTGFLMDGHCNEMYRFHFINRTWEIVNTKGEAPSGRSRSRAVVYKDRMYLLGGFNMQRRSSLGDFYEFNFKTHTWKRVYASNIPTISQHSFDLYGNTIFTFGGFHEKARNSLYAIKLTG